jgi:hypothetical protein
LTWDSQNLEDISVVNIYRSGTDSSSLSLHETVDKSINTFTDTGLTKGRTYHYALTVVDTNLIESFRTQSLSITPGTSFTFQAEDASFTGNVFVETNHLGYHGTAFVNFDSNSSAVEFTNMPGFGGGIPLLQGGLFVLVGIECRWVGSHDFCSAGDLLD